MPVNSVVRVVELPKRCRIRPRRPRCGRRRLNRAELAPHLMPGNQPSHGLRARHQLYLPRQLGAGAAVSPHKRASHAAQAAAAAPPPHPRGRRDGWSCHNSLVAAPTLFTAAPGRFYGPPASHPGGPSRGLLRPQASVCKALASTPRLACELKRTRGAEPGTFHQRNRSFLIAAWRSRQRWDARSPSPGR